MAETIYVVRCLASRIRTCDEDEYRSSIPAWGLSREIGASPDLGSEILMRRLGDGFTRVCALTRWSSFETLRSFTEAEPRLPASRFGARLLLDRPALVSDYEVIATTGQRIPALEPDAPRGRNSINY